MSWIGSLVGMVVGGKTAVREGDISKQFAAAANMMTPFVSKAGGDLKRWGEEDFERFKEKYRPVAERLVDDANRAPDYNRTGREVAIAAGRGEAGANEGIIRRASMSGIDPSSGRFAAESMGIASNSARLRGIGAPQAKLEAERESTGKKLRVLNMGRSDPSASIAGLGLVTKSGAEYGKYAGDFAQRAAGGWGAAAKGAGQAIGSFRRSGGVNYDSANQSWSNSSMVDGKIQPKENFSENIEQYSGYADGGVIRGPGTGRSDSIPAVIDGAKPARVSNGEYHITADVAAKIGLPKLNALISIAPK